MRRRSLPSSPSFSPSAPARRPLLEALERRQLFAIVGPDLIGTGISLSASNPMPYSGDVTINFSIKNDGGLFGNAGAFWVTFWDTDDHPHDEYISYSRITDVWVEKLDSGKTYNGSVTIPRQFAGNDNEGFVMMQIDSRSAQGEWNENNNFRVAEGKDFVGYSAEGDLERNPQPWTPTRGRALSVNGSLTGAIGDEAVGARDYDIFDVNVNAGQRYMVDLDRIGSSSLDSFVRVYDANWNLVAQNDNGRDENEAASNDAYTEFRPSAGGTYHIVVSNAFNHWSDPRVLTDRTFSSDSRATGAYAISMHSIHDPIVNAAVIDANATEGLNYDSAVVRISRSGSPDNALSVAWSIGGSADYGTDYTLESAGSFSLTHIVIPQGQQYVDVRINALDNGTWEATETVRFTLYAGSGYGVGFSGTSTVNILNAPQDRPRVLWATDVFTDNAGHRVSFRFDDYVGNSLDLNDLSLVDADTNLPLDRTKLSISWSDSESSAVIRFTGFPSGMLPNGNYRLQLLGSGVTNAGGMSMDYNPICSFFSLAGDANRDRKVDFDDLLVLSQNYGAGGRELAGGNIDGSADGKVDFSDLLILSQNYGKTLPNPLAAPSGTQGALFATTPIEQGQTASRSRSRSPAATVIALT